MSVILIFDRICFVCITTLVFTAMVLSILVSYGLINYM